MVLAKSKQHNESFLKSESCSGYSIFNLAVISSLEPIQARYKELIGDHSEIIRVIEEGKATAEELAQRTLKRVQNAIGLINSK